MLDQCGRCLVRDFFKYKRRLSNVASKSFDRWKSDGFRILFFGTDNFSLPSLKKLNEARQNIQAVQSLEVVTSFKKPKNPVLKYAEAESLKIHSWPLEGVGNIFDLGVVVSFGHLIPESVISLCSNGMINVHASLLPRWRGAAPIIYAIKNGDETTGVSIMKIEPKHFDVGDILAQREVTIREDMLLPELHERMAREGADLLLSTILRYPQALKEARSQDNSQATYAPKITPEICDVDWNQMSAVQVFNLYRALYSFKNVTTKWQSQVIKLMEIRRSSQTDDSAKPGFVQFSRNRKCLLVHCQGGSCIEVLKLCIEGKKSMSAVDFNNGFLNGCSTEKRYFVHDVQTPRHVKISKQN